MHAAAAEALVGFLGKGRRVLDVGSGSGFLVGVLGGLVFGSDVPSTTTTSEGVSGDGGEHGVGDGAKQGLVVGVEHIEALRALGERNLGKSEIGRKWLESGRVRFVLGDGRKGWRGEGGEEGWDVIVSFSDCFLSFVGFLFPFFALFLMFLSCWHGSSN